MKKKSSEQEDYENNPYLFEQYEKDKEKIKAKKMRLKESAARNSIILNNMRLVGAVLKKYNIPYQEYEDFQQIGFIGLIKAVDNYKHIEGNKFSSFAYLCIKNEIGTVLKTKSYYKPKEDISLSSPVGKEGKECELGTILPNKELDIIDYIYKKDEIKNLHKIVKEMTHKEQDLISLLYSSDKSVNQKSLSQKYRCTQSSISRNLVKVKTKLTNELLEFYKE